MFYVIIIICKVILSEKNSNLLRKTFSHCIFLHHLAGRAYRNSAYVLTSDFKVHNMTINVDTRMERSSYAFGSLHADETFEIKSNGI